MPCRNPCRLYIHLAFTYSIGPTSIVCEASLDRLRLFHQWECLNYNGRGFSVSCVVALNILSIVYVWQLSFNFKYKVYVTFWTTQMNVNQHLHSILKCHLNVTCLVVHVVSISNVSIDMRFFSFTSHTTCQILNCAYQLLPTVNPPSFI